MKLLIVFLISFAVVAFIFALVAAFSTIFYRGKSVSELSPVERKILHREATLGDRILIFLSNFISSYAAPPIYFTAVLLTAIFWMVSPNGASRNNPNGNLKNPSTFKQDTTEYIYFKDSTKIPKNLILMPLVESVREQNGDLINAEAYCSCLVEKLTESFTAKEFVDFFKNGESLNSSNFFSTDFGQKVLIECLPNNINLNSEAKYPSDFKMQMQMQILNEIQNDPKFKSNVNLFDFSNCLVEKITSQYTYPEYLKLNAEDALLKNPKFIQSKDSCFKESLINF